MRFISRHMLEGEKIVFQTRVHWMTVAPWFFGAIICLIGIWFIREDLISSALVAVFGVILLLKAVTTTIFFLCTVYAITTHRVLGKTGLISIESLDVLLIKVESVKLDKGLMGRIFGFGDLIVAGSGGTQSVLHSLPKPQKVRKLLQQLANRAHAKTDGLKVDFEHEIERLKKVV